jgi:uroporphyrinogen decarboxylase
VACWLGLPLLLQLTPGAASYSDLFRLWCDDPLSIVAVQERLGLDPLVLTHTEHPGEVITLPRMQMRWPAAAMAEWQERREVIGQEADHQVVRRTVATPGGQLSYTYRLDDHARATFEHLLKEEADLELLRFLPDPAEADLSVIERMVQAVGGRAIFHHVTPGVWDEACQLRGVNHLATDLFDRPAWVHRLLRFNTDRQARLMARLGQAGVQTINYNETWVGFGMSPKTYREFVLPYDAEVVAASHRAGMLVSYHNCGRASRLLELHADTGADALETLTPAGRSGDVELADAARRVGQRITLFGGFNEHVLTHGDLDDVRAEARRCLAAAAGARYILRTTGQIMAARPGNIEAMVETARG